MGLSELFHVTAAGPVSEAQARLELERGRRLLAAGDRDGAATALRRAAMVPQTQLPAHNLIETHKLVGNFCQVTGVEARIDPDDDVYRFFVGYGTWSSPMRDYLADGWRSLSELMRLLELVHRPLMQTRDMLEFASGHGRLTRHLVKSLGAGRVTVSDVVPGAVRFAQQAFGVQGFVSTPEPQQLQWPRRWDLVFVLSLFSHLPQATWSAWLDKLWQAVAPGGLLVFSTHGAEAVRRTGVKLDSKGYFFVPSSESTAISAQEYGTAFTSEAFVRAQVARVAGAQTLVHFAPAWFWDHQDAWVLQA